MERRGGLEIKKKILKILKENKEVSLGELERKTNTNNLTILNHIKELEYFGFVKTIKYDKSKHTGRPFTRVKLIKEFS